MIGIGVIMVLVGCESAFTEIVRVARIGMFRG